jgi:hypothetical protein
MNETYYLIHFAECGGIQYELEDITIENIFKSKNTLEYHKKQFYRTMVEYFSQFEESYVPKDISEIEVEPLIHKVILELTSAGIIKAKFEHNESSSRAIGLHYGVSGGLHMDFCAILIPSDSFTLYI